MIRLFKYNLNSEFLLNKDKLSNLDNYLAYINETNDIEFRMPKIYLKYSITDELLSFLKENSITKVPLLNRVDLYKTIKIDGKEIDLSNKIRTPYTITSSTSEDMLMEISSMMSSLYGNMYNETYCIVIDIDKPDVQPKNGIIELEFQDNLTFLVIACLLLKFQIHFLKI